MKAATSGAKPEWYSLPADVEKVAICRVSGARARDQCRQAAVETELMPVAWPPQPRSPYEAAAGETGVYEDLFPIGQVPPDLCPLHGSGG
jgi:hypothetical protein